MKIKHLVSLDRLAASQARARRAADRILSIVHSRTLPAGQVRGLDQARR